jgi:hypothetical protein
VGWVITILPISIPLLAGIATVIALYLSKPEKKIPAFICAAIAIGVSTWNATQQYSSQSATAQVQTHVYDKLSLHTHRFLGGIADMIVYSTDGWLPNDESEFFSRRSVDLICHELNADALARVIPKRLWYVWFAETTQEYKNVLGDLLSNYSSRLIRAISDVERSTLLIVPIQWGQVRSIAQKRGWQYPPLLCYGLEDLIEESFVKLSALVGSVRRSYGVIISVPAT